MATLKDHYIAWNPTEKWMAGAKLVKWPRQSRSEDEGYRMTWGACNFDVNKAARKDRQAMLFMCIYHMIAVDGVNPKDIHSALMPLEEYRDALSDDFEIDGRA